MFARLVWPSLFLSSVTAHGLGQTVPTRALLVPGAHGAPSQPAACAPPSNSKDNGIRKAHAKWGGRGDVRYL